MAKKKEIIPCIKLKEEKRNRLFIENDQILRDSIKHSVERDVRCEWKDFFSKTIVNARQEENVDLFKAISEAEDIFLWTSFIQESGYMFNAMAKMAMQTGLTGKRIFIFRQKEDLLRYAHFDEKIFRKVSKTNKFYFLDEEQDNFVLS